MLFYCHRHFRSKTLIKTDAISMSCPCSIFCTQCIFQVSIEDTWNNSGKTDAKKDLFDEKVSRSSDSQYVIEVMRGVLTVRLCFEKLTQVCKQIFSWKRIGRTMTTYRWGTRVYARKVASKHQMRQRGRGVLRVKSNRIGWTMTINEGVSKPEDGVLRAKGRCALLGLAPSWP